MSQNQPCVDVFIAFLTEQIEETRLLHKESQSEVALLKGMQ